ncbi:hypothetical protein JCGZ_15056 [Jatropha curcas]|uniref:Uncharacterized protein n=1 Tax=Jatropha curcas TaxID=180498 RepID=A0A067L9R2_JATCU|nr:hypothetical protein JCGZ_15056 [Jatropha curcas]
MRRSDHNRRLRTSVAEKTKEQVNEGTGLVALLSRSERNLSSLHLLCQPETKGERDRSFAVNEKEAGVDRSCWIRRKDEERGASCRSKSQLPLLVATLKQNGGEPKTRWRGGDGR